jgi:AcrR family transcriptional regulator
MVMATAKTGPRQRLTRADWAAAALAAIAEGGLAAVAVEPLAARLGATKGSFYWHFPNRQALLAAALAHWEQVHTTAISAEVEAVAGGPVAQLRLLIKRAGEAQRERIGLALLATADHPAVAPVLARVTQRRLEFLAQLFAQLGFPAAAARQRALLAYSAYVGQAQLADATPQLLPRGRAAQRAYLDHVLTTLTTLPGRHDSAPTDRH